MKPPAFQFYVDDFLGGTMHFTDAEVGLYIRLLCIQWSTGSIPDNDMEIASYSKDGNTPIHRVKSKFHKGEDGNLRNPRMELVRKAQQDYIKSRSRNGRKGGRPRKPYGKHMVSIAKAQGKHSESSPTPTPTPTPTPISSLQPLKDQSASPPVSGGGEHVAFIDGWVQNFKAKFGFDYSFDGGRDGKAVRELLKMGVLRIDLLEIAKQAWDKSGKTPKFFNCDQSVTIHGFRNHFNQIRTEIKNGAQTPQRVNPRNIGISRPSTGGDYGEAAKRKLERQALEAQHRAASEAQGNGTPSGPVLHGDVGTPTGGQAAGSGGQ